jgi:Fe-S oxidoreductase/FAD/FMN-containing dehydrogenase
MVMGRIDIGEQSYLSKKFGNRVSFHKTERKLYGHDIAAIPGVIKLFVGDTTPEAVVQPLNEEELVGLVHWATEKNVPLTPRGKGSSGYGGVLPLKKGVVVDFYRMNRIIRIDPIIQTATVQAGMVWERLDRELKKHGMTLWSYPSSYPGSTVGGWLAQGGAGIGSYEAGWFRDIVVSARVILPDGAVKEFSGPELDLISDAEGITGLISEITLRIQPLEDLEVLSIGSPDAYKLQQLAQALMEKNLPIWSIIFINPRMAQLKNRAPLLEHHGHPVEERVPLPEAYITTLAFRSKDRQNFTGSLPEIVRSCDSELLNHHIAQHEWENRFKLMIVKRLGPSLVPTEVVIPLSALGDVMTEMENKIAQPIVKEGVIIRRGIKGQPEVVILGFIPSDQRQFSYNLVFGLTLTVLKIAKKHGGRPYSTGLYFSNKANKVLGRTRFERLKAFKTRIDPKTLLNPGKVIAKGFISRIISLAGVFEPFIRPIANSVRTEIGERAREPVREIPADIAWYAYACSQCGYCIEECDQFYGRGWESQSPRGKWYWLREYMEGREKWNQFMVDAILVCTTCELCNLRCSVSLPIEPSWMKLRGHLITKRKRMTFPPFEMMAAALQGEGDIWTGYRKDRSLWFPKDLEERHGPSHRSKVVYFAGCTASYVEQDIGIASVRLLDRGGVDFSYLGQKETCCGTPMLVAGKWDVFEEIVRKNIEAVKEAGADTVVTSCPACDMMWRQVYPEWSKKLKMEYGIKTKHYSEVIAEKIRAGEFAFPGEFPEPLRVTWHDSCHIGRASGVFEPPRQLIRALPNIKLVEMSHHREEAHCCGSILTLIKDPGVAAEIGEARLKEALEVGAEKILSLCPCCQVQLRVTAQKKQIPIEVVDLAHFTASTLGYEFPDPDPEVQKQWAVFEAMISLMTPKGFADLMGSMWPELISTMPFGMGSMMRLMGRIPGTLELMKPMFPILFPRLLPVMIPKVMSAMLQRIEEHIAMPPSMREQMPEMMPKVMENLMPHMIQDIVPLVTQPMINFLRGRRETGG